jgi:hypothetical protein
LAKKSKDQTQPTRPPLQKFARVESRGHGIDDAGYSIIVRRKVCGTI